jgi:hypothetical protein
MTDQSPTSSSCTSECRNGRESNSLEGAFLRQHIMDDRRNGMELVVSEEIYHVVKVTGACPLGNCAHFPAKTSSSL